MAWKIVRDVFAGGTKEARALFGKKIRVANGMIATPYVPSGMHHDAGNSVDARVTIARGDTGFVGHVPPEHLDMIVLVFPKGAQCPATVEQLQRQPFKTVLTNWPSFRANFMIDA